jgi:hypothetical protein
MRSSGQQGRWAGGLAVAAITAAATVALAHVAPSVDDNNRYAKLTPLGDRVRFAYTVFFGEIPGAQERQTIDANHDGQISGDEAGAFGAHLAAEIAAQLDVSVDGVQTPVAWNSVDVGITADAKGGSFSVDLVDWLCLATERGHHTVRVLDHFRLPHMGETEIKVEDAPGVQLARVHIGRLDEPSHDFRFTGPAGPWSDDGLELVFEAGDTAPVTRDATCRAAAPATRSHTWLIGLIVGIVAVGGAIAGAAWYRRRTR